MSVTFISTLFITIQDGLLWGLIASVVSLLFQLSHVTLIPLGLEPCDVQGRPRLVSKLEHKEALDPIGE